MDFGGEIIGAEFRLRINLGWKTQDRGALKVNGDTIAVLADPRSETRTMGEPDYSSDQLLNLAAKI